MELTTLRKLKRNLNWFLQFVAEKFWRFFLFVSSLMGYKNILPR